MTERALHPLTEEEYLALEEESPIRHELLGGYPYAMAGASLDHNLIVTNLVALLKPLARAKGCRVYSETARLKLSEDTFYYPDVMVVCGPKAHPLYETAPCLVVEVLSGGTEAQDKREKRSRYLSLPSLQGYLILESEGRGGVLYRRTPEGFREETLKEAFTLPCLEGTLGLEAIYEGLA
ncbi:MAG: Uma2 family endonuclease [Thermus sp.]|uniref:Uma2 family endonuclease n=1 Tax=Thermus sp. TaxID=275 RepID=UPI00351AC59F